MGTIFLTGHVIESSTASRIAPCNNLLDQIIIKQQDLRHPTNSSNRRERERKEAGKKIKERTISTEYR